MKLGGGTCSRIAPRRPGLSFPLVAPHSQPQFLADFSYLVTLTLFLPRLSSPAPGIGLHPDGRLPL